MWSQLSKRTDNGLLLPSRPASRPVILGPWPRRSAPWPGRYSWWRRSWASRRSWVGSPSSNTPMTPRCSSPTAADPSLRRYWRCGHRCGDPVVGMDRRRRPHHGDRWRVCLAAISKALLRMGRRRGRGPRRRDLTDGGINIAIRYRDAHSPSKCLLSGRVDRAPHRGHRSLVLRPRTLGRACLHGRRSRGPHAAPPLAWRCPRPLHSGAQCAHCHSTAGSWPRPQGIGPIPIPPPTDGMSETSQGFRRWGRRRMSRRQGTCRGSSGTRARRGAWVGRVRRS
jgi:hypothetical protein